MNYYINTKLFAKLFPMCVVCWRCSTYILYIYNLHKQFSSQLSYYYSKIIIRPKNARWVNLYSLFWYLWRRLNYQGPCMVGYYMVSPVMKKRLRNIRHRMLHTEHYHTIVRIVLNCNCFWFWRSREKKKFKDCLTYIVWRIKEFPERYFFYR